MPRYTGSVASAVRTEAPRGRSKRRSRSPRWWRVTKIILALIAVGALIGALSGVGFLLYLRSQAANVVVDFDALVQGTPPRTSVIFAADGTKLYETVPERRNPIRLKEVPEHVQNAVLAAEDVRFRTRGSAVDFEALGRAVYGRSRGENKGGGSTLAMQLAKLKFSKSENTMKRKLQDMAIAQAMEERLTRDQILELYLNEVYFGEGATGVAAASKTYFGKSVTDLSYAEAAMLARCVRRPSDQNPVRNYAKALENGHVVLRLMKAEGWITEEKYKTAMKSKPRITKLSDRTTTPIKKAGYFVSSVLAELRDKGVDITNGGYAVYTTLDTGLQERAEREVREVVANNRRNGVNTAAFVLVNRDGQILAEVGGVDYRRNKYNMVTMGGLQPGSAFKPIVYATALEKEVITEYSSISNAPIRIKQSGGKFWQPRNSGGQRNRSYPLETAFRLSINLPAIHTIQQVGPSQVVKYATDKFGFEPAPGKPMLAVPSLALGTCQVTPLEMAQAYSVFMTGGTRVKPYAIERVVAPDGKIELQGGPTRFENVLRAETCEIIDRMMEAVVQRGTGTAARNVKGARGKTGTTNDAKDAWFCGYAEGLIGIGWIGNEKNGRRYAMRDNVFGGTVTVQMWRGVMDPAVEKYGTRVVKSAPKPDENKPRRRRRENTDEPAPSITTADETADIEPSDPVVSDQPPITVDDPSLEPPQLVPEREETPPPATRPRPRARPRPTPPPEEEATSEVEICADSGARARPYCPETVTRTFARSKRPRSRCPVHTGNG